MVVFLTNLLYFPSRTFSLRFLYANHCTFVPFDFGVPFDGRLRMSIERRAIRRGERPLTLFGMPVFAKDGRRTNSGITWAFPRNGGLDDSDLAQSPALYPESVLFTDLIKNE